MPVSKVKVTVSREFFRRIASDLDLENVPSLHYKRHTEHGKIGWYELATNRVFVCLGLQYYDSQHFGIVQQMIRKNILHEFRHAHQWAHWDHRAIALDKMLPYEFQGIEIDANRWRDEAYLDYRDEITVTRRVHSKIGALGKAS